MSKGDLLNFMNHYLMIISLCLIVETLFLHLVPVLSNPITISHNGTYKSKRDIQPSNSIPFVHTSGLIDSPEIRTVAAAVCKAQCLQGCVDNLKQKSITDATIDAVLKMVKELPAQLRSECSRLSLGFLYFDECEQACESDRPYTDCVRICETGDSPSGWSCLTGCRLLDAALKQRSGECPPQGGPAIHRLPALSDPKLSRQWLDDANSVHPIEYYDETCTMDAECPNKRHKCCQSHCREAVFRNDLLPSVPILQILEAKTPPSFILSWSADDVEQPSATNGNHADGFSNLTVYVLQVKTYFGPEFDSRLSSEWKTLVMSTQTGAQLSEPRVGWWYQFQVAAVNRWGSLGFNIPSPPVHLSNQQPHPPSAPSNLLSGLITLQADGKVRVDVHWSAPIDESIPVTEYRIKWGLDNAQPRRENYQSSLISEFVHTVPSTEESFQLTDLEPNSLYHIEVIAISEWGPTLLRSHPTTIFVRTPATEHLQTTSERSPFDSFMQGNEDFTANFPNSDLNGRVYDVSTADSDRCVCDGTSRAVTYPTHSPTKPTTELDLQIGPVLFDGKQVRVIGQLYEIQKDHGKMKDSLQTNNRFVYLQWIPQVCINSPDSEISTGLSSSSSSSSEYESQSKSDRNQLMKSKTVTLRPHSGVGNHSVLRSGEVEFNDLILNCRYLIEASSPSDPVSRMEVDAVKMRACLCTPSCSEVTLAPWIPKLDCHHEDLVIPSPEQLRHHLVNESPLSYNISWSAGRWTPKIHGTRTIPPNLLDGVGYLRYRIAWGPSRDQPIDTKLWETWPGLKPRMDPMKAETKVLRNGETFMLLQGLQPNTQYIIELQALFNAQRLLIDPKRKTHRSAQGYPNGLNTLSSKEIYMYFETPRLDDHLRLENRQMYGDQSNGSDSKHHIGKRPTLLLLVILSVWSWSH